jgi:hypothetical protein
VQLLGATFCQIYFLTDCTMIHYDDCGLRNIGKMGGDDPT